MLNRGEHTTEPASLPPRTQAPNAGPGASDEVNEFLSGLRREFPRWGILLGTTRTPWIAVRSLQLRRLEITAENGITLRERLLAATERDRTA